MGNDQLARHVSFSSFPAALKTQEQNRVAPTGELGFFSLHAASMRRTKPTCDFSGNTWRN
jgi:hypothetical protein